MKLDGLGDQRTDFCFGLGGGYHTVEVGYIRAPSRLSTFDDDEKPEPEDRARRPTLGTRCRLNQREDGRMAAEYAYLETIGQTASA